MKYKVKKTIEETFEIESVDVEPKPKPPLVRGVATGSVVILSVGLLSVLWYGLVTGDVDNALKALVIIAGLLTIAMKYLFGK